MKNKRFIKILSSIIVILLIPLLAMQFTDEVNWSLIDFIVAGVLLFSAGFAYETFARRSNKTTYKVIVGFIILLILLLIWAELAVGIFGTPWAGS